MIALALCASLLAGLPLPARAQTSSCYPGTAPEESGPTDISAVTGNRTLTAAFNPRGTMTVLKWPSPSFYDQLDYRTTDRSQPRMGAAANDGAFLGFAWRRAARGSKWHFSWLRNWATTQTFADADGDEIVTTHKKRKIGVTVRVRDVVAATEDSLVRAVRVERTTASPVKIVRIFSFANFNPVYSKSPSSPEDDWCTDEGSDRGATFAKDSDAVVHASSGQDESTGENSSVALVMAFGRDSDGHSIGSDPDTSAYDDAADAALENNAMNGSASDAAMFDQVRMTKRRRAGTDVIFTAGRTERAALDTLDTTRAHGVARVRSAKARWWRNWLASSPLPKNAPRSVVVLAKRSLIALRQVLDRKGLAVTSIATQSPLALDWVRNGAYIDAALARSGHLREMKKHALAYGRHQAKLEASTTPRGNWPTSMYADGVPGSSTPYEIDSTGLGLWTLWEGYRHSKDINHLANVYEAIRRAADHLTDTCVDLATGLQCPAHEEGGTSLSRSLVGAQAAWLGLDSAVAAARQAMKYFGHSAQKRDEWRARRDQLRNAIRNNLYNASCDCYTENMQTAGTFLWPVGLFARTSRVAERHADLVWKTLRKRINGKVEQGAMEARGLVGLAHTWKGRPQKMRLVKRGLVWLASEKVTSGTGLLGGAWRVRKGRTEIMRSQPHAWHHAMFYVAALKAYGTRPYSF